MVSRLDICDLKKHDFQTALKPFLSKKILKHFI
jgi:hypothetical protein